MLRLEVGPSDFLRGKFAPAATALPASPVPVRLLLPDRGTLRQYRRLQTAAEGAGDFVDGTPPTSRLYAAIGHVRIPALVVGHILFGPLFSGVSSWTGVADRASASRSASRIART